VRKSPFFQKIRGVMASPVHLQPPQSPGSPADQSLTPPGSGRKSKSPPPLPLYHPSTGQQLRPRLPSDAQQEESNLDVNQRLKRAASVPLGRASPRISPEWESVYKKPFFSDEAQFQAVVEYVKKRLATPRLDQVTSGIFQLIKNAGFLQKADASMTVNLAVRRCMTTASLSQVAPSVKFEMLMESLKSVLDEISIDMGKLQPKDPDNNKSD
jgi:hypothetical protein